MGLTRSQVQWKSITSFPALMAALLAGAMFVPLRNFFVDPDVWWHIKVGATILATHCWPTGDPYSFTAHGSHWIAYEWLGDVVLAAVQGAWGLQGLMAFDFVLAALILFSLYMLATMRCGNSKAAFVTCAVLLPLIYQSCSLRPQMFGYLFLALTLIALERFRQGHAAALWLLPPLFLVWVNTHGSFVLGLFALGVYWASGLIDIHWGEVASRRWTAAERVRLELIALLILIALTITPYGTEVCLYPLDMAFGQPINVANIVEWQSMPFGEIFAKLFLVLVMAFLFAQVTLRPAWRLEELLLFFAGIVAACLHVRFVLIFVPFGVSLFAVIVARAVPPYEPAKDKYALNAILILLVVAGVWRFFPSRARLETQVEEKWPVRVVDYMQKHPPPQPMLNSYGFGGYLIWSMSDVNRVFIDGRVDIYERTGVLTDYLNMARLGFPAPFLLNAYNIQSCVLDRKETLVTLLDVSPEWQKVYGDQISVLYVRRHPAEVTGARSNTGAEAAGRLRSSRASGR